MIFNIDNSVNIKIKLPKHTDVELSVKREDLIHREISGNKYRKLKYNIIEAKRLNVKTLLTYGGAFSNHISAVAFAGKEYNLSTIGVIRGDELLNEVDNNPTLKFAKNCGMRFKFVSRSDYRLKESVSFSNKLKKEFGAFYNVPEGGTNKFAIKGCEEILTKNDAEYDFICCAVGTGGTISGLIQSTCNHQKVIGFPALKGIFLNNEIKKWTSKTNWELTTDYHFGGYAKVNSELIKFINNFKAETDIPLDPIYTGKMMFGIFDLIKKGFFPIGSKILAIHTGGLQGIKGMNIVLQKKGLPIII